MWIRRSLVVVSLFACGGPKPGSCEATAKQMGKATKLVAWKPPADCTAKGGGQTPKALGKEADARTHVACKDLQAKLGVDFTKRQLIVTARSSSTSTTTASRSPSSAASVYRARTIRDRCPDRTRRSSTRRPHVRRGVVQRLHFVSPSTRR
jgi:hypothetical protein